MFMLNRGGQRFLHLVRRGNWCQFSFDHRTLLRVAQSPERKYFLGEIRTEILLFLLILYLPGRGNPPFIYCNWMRMVSDQKQSAISNAFLITHASTQNQGEGEGSLWYLHPEKWQHFMKAMPEMRLGKRGCLVDVYLHSISFWKKAGGNLLAKQGLNTWWYT